MWSRVELKRNGKIAFLRNYWMCVLVSFLVALIGGATYSVTINFQTNSTEDVKRAWDNLPAQVGTLDRDMLISIMIVYFVSTVIVTFAGVLCLIFFAGNIATVGGCRYYLENREHKTSLSQMFYGFTDGRYKNCMTTMLMRWLIVFAYSLLLVIPGIIKAYSYLLVPYILAENPHMDRKRALELSQEMMEGHKWEAFVLRFSFIGWFLLSSISGGLLNIFWVEPYITATFAEYYTALKSEAIYKGITSHTELPGVSVHEGMPGC